MSRFRFCLNASTIATTPILQQLKVTKEAGYEAIELWHDHMDAYLATGGTLRDLCKAVEDSGLTIPTTIYLTGWFQPAGVEHEKALDEVKRRLEQSAAVGAKFSIAGPPPGKADRDLGAKHYAELLDIGRSFGVRPAFEYLGFVEDINTIDDAIDIVQRSGRPDATVVVDPFHCHRGGGSMESLSKLRADQIAISHFNDCPAFPAADQQQDSDRVFPGDGVVNLNRYCDLLSGTGYNGFLSLELFREDLYSLDPLHVAKLGLEKIKTFVEV